MQSPIAAEAIAIPAARLGLNSCPIVGKVHSTRETESTLSKAVTIIALTGFLVFGAVGTAILGRDGLPAAGAAMAAPANPFRAVVSNWENKSDRLTVAAAAPAAAEPAQTGTIASEALRQAYAATPSAGIEGLKIDDSNTPQVPLKTRIVAKPPAQKSYALLSEAQIAGIKERLKLSPSQEYYWPAVENALRAVARKIHAARHADPNGSGAPIIDPEAEEVQQLKSAAMPLLFQLREDQKREVRTLARLIGLDKVAAAI